MGREHRPDPATSPVTGLSRTRRRTGAWRPSASRVSMPGATWAATASASPPRGRPATPRLLLQEPRDSPARRRLLGLEPRRLRPHPVVQDQFLPVAVDEPVHLGGDGRPASLRPLAIPDPPCLGRSRPRAGGSARPGERRTGARVQQSAPRSPPPAAPPGEPGRDRPRSRRLGPRADMGRPAAAPTPGARRASGARRRRA